MRPPLGLHFNPTNPPQVAYARACGIQYGRASCYVANMKDQRYFSTASGSDPWDPNDPANQGQSPPAGYKRAVDWFYLGMKAYRDNGFQVVMTFQKLSDDDTETRSRSSLRTS